MEYLAKRGRYKIHTAVVDGELKCYQTYGGGDPKSIDVRPWFKEAYNKRAMKMNQNIIVKLFRRLI